MSPTSMGYNPFSTPPAKWSKLLIYRCVRGSMKAYFVRLSVGRYYDSLKVILLRLMIPFMLSYAQRIANTEVDKIIHYV